MEKNNIFQGKQCHLRPHIWNKATHGQKEADVPSGLAALWNIRPLFDHLWPYSKVTGLKVTIVFLGRNNLLKDKP